jgi:uncharacterized protein (DUF2126 family)
MKTIQEAAQEYAAQETRVTRSEHVAFVAGVEFAQRWISVEEELPPKELENGDSKTVFVKDEFGDCGFCHYSHKSRKWTNGIHVGDWMGVVYWRPVELQ